MTDRVRIILPWMTFWLLAFSIWAVRDYEQPALIFVSIGAAGTVLMLFTELAYTYRKKGIVRIGPLPWWLRIHMVTGIAGPALIIWHSRLEFYGFAGWLAGATLVVVASGIFGHILFRVVGKGSGLKKRAQELEAEGRQDSGLQRRLHRVEIARHLLAKWRFLHCLATIVLFGGVLIHIIGVFYFGQVLG